MTCRDIWSVIGHFGTGFDSKKKRVKSLRLDMSNLIALRAIYIYFSITNNTSLKFGKWHDVLFLWIIDNATHEMACIARHCRWKNIHLYIFVVIWSNFKYNWEGRKSKSKRKHKRNNKHKILQWIYLRLFSHGYVLAPKYVLV